jgi:hypothetical protein
LNCLKPTLSPFLSHSALFTLINKDGRANSRISLQSTVGKIVSFLIGIAVIWMLIKAIQKIFSKIKDNNNRYKAKSSVVSLVIFNYNSFNSCFSDKLGNLTVALGVAGAGIALHFKSNRFICRLASHHVWRFYNTEIAFNLAEIKAM